MNPRLAFMFFALLGGVSTAQEKASAPIAPRPRVRLDPALLSSPASASSKIEQPPGTPGILMDKFVVREKGPVPSGPRKPDEPQGKFTVLGGGHFLHREVGGASVELGLWPWVDILGEDAKFRPARTRVDMDLVRVKW